MSDPPTSSTQLLHAIPVPELHDSTSTLMSFMFKDFGSGLTEHIKAHERITALLKTYFYGVIYAPCIILSIGQELGKLRDLIEQLLNESDEIRGQASVIFRSDNKLAAQKAVQLAIRGVNTTLKGVEGNLQDGKVHRGQTEKWWTIFTKKIQVNGGDKIFQTTLGNLRYHTWAFGLVLRILKRNNMDMLLEIAEQSDHYIDELLADLLSATGDDSMDEAVTRKFAEYAEFNGAAFPTAFRIETALRISMYWTFNAIANIKGTQFSKQLSDEDCLSLFKAYWIFQNFREDPRVKQMPKEFQAIMVAVSTELAIAAKIILEVKVKVPRLESLINSGDFRILLGDFGEDEVEDKILEIHPSRPHRDRQFYLLAPAPAPPTPPREDFGVGQDTNGPSVIMSKTAVHPAAYNTYEGYNYRDDISPDPVRSPSNMTTYNQINRKPVTMAPPSPPDPQRRSSINQFNGPRNSRNLPPSPGGSSDGGYRDSPTLGTRSFGGLSRSSTVIGSTVIDSMRFGVPPLSEEPRARENPSFRGPLVPEKPNHLQNQRPMPPHLNPSEISLSPSTYNPPFSPDSISPTTRGSVGMPHEASHMETPDQGVRPGETEILGEAFRAITILASDTCDAGSAWDECVVRVFKNSVGDLRILTLRERRVDQRLITIKDAELIPEYGYHMHENLPVIFIRKAGPGGYSQQSGRRSQGMSLGSVELSAASLYYKFTTLADMFGFQQALLGETVLADVQVVRTIRYRRGLLDGETSNHTCRVQIWREQNNQSLKSPGTSVGATSISGTYRAKPNSSLMKPRTTRVVMFLGQVLLTLFVTDDVTIEEKTRNIAVRIKPTSYTFSGRSSIKACTLGSRELSGGIRLDKEGLLIQDEERFDDYKWFEIDFRSPAEMNVFTDAFSEALQVRRKERIEIEELRKKAASGARA